uniref:Uncharacterized protein n=1 Tax=Candidozyma auris TaxID=498019 RepID=A0A0L0P0F1_CANAR
MEVLLFDSDLQLTHTVRVIELDKKKGGDFKKNGRLLKSEDSNSL